MQLIIIIGIWLTAVLLGLVIVIKKLNKINNGPKTVGKIKISFDETHDHTELRFIINDPYELVNQDVVSFTIEKSHKNVTI